MDVSRFSVESVIIHDIPKRGVGNASTGPILSDECADLTTPLREFFQARVRSSLTTAGREITPLPPVDVPATDNEPARQVAVSPVPQAVAEFLAGTVDADTLVPFSKDIAHVLYEAHTLATSGGLLIVMLGTVVDRPAVALLKVEREEGLGLEYQAVGDHHVMMVEHLNNIMMTQNTKVFKAGMFALYNNSLSGFASDEQSGAAKIGKVAEFFLKTFLGCTYAETSAVLTLKFFKATEAFLSQRVGVAARAGYLQALLVEMHRGQPSVNVQTFAADHMGELADDYLHEIQDAGIPLGGFQKNDQFVSDQMSRLQWTTESGTRIVAPSAEYGDSVKIEALENGDIQISVVGRIKALKPT